MLAHKLRRAGVFPSVLSSQSSTDVDGGSTVTVTLPGSIVSGNLLVAIVSEEQARTATWPAGWTELLDYAPGASGLHVGYRVADGAEGASITVTLSSTAAAASSLVYKISGAGSTIYGGTATGTSATPDPPSLSPAPGYKKYLWLSVVSGRDALTSIDTYPANYTNGQKLETADGFGAFLGVAERLSTASSDDPGTFGVGASAEWYAATIAIPSA